MAVCGLVDVKLTLNLINCWLNGKSLSLIVMTSARVCGRRGRLYFVDERARVIAAYYLEKVLLKLGWKIVNSCNRMISSFSKTPIQLTRQASHRTG